MKQNKKRTVQGLIKRHPDGFGFLIPEDKSVPDLYIPHHGMTGIMANDKVLAEVIPEKGSDRFRGEIIKVVSRGLKKVVGHFARLNESYGLVRDEAHGWGQDLRIRIEDSMNAKDGELVACEILTYPDRGEKFTGKVVEVIGDAEDPMNDIRRVVHGNNIPEEFPEDVLEEASHFGEQPSERDFRGRRDLRNRNLITIDGATAKDFDDAVLVEMFNEGFRLFVAIADVSHYVQPGSAIDREAYQRGTSVYFPNFVIPMLPEVLSNGLCSLNPKVPRLCLVAEMTFDFTGTMTSSEFYEGVMESKARVTYGRAQEVIDGNAVPELEHVRETILRCGDLAKILMAKRFRDGSLDLEIPETQLQIDGAGRPVDVIRSERLFAHRLIEELMLAANVAVAKFLAGKDIPAIYRVHEPPNEMAMKVLERYLEAFGSHTKLEGGKLQKRITRALQEFDTRSEAQILNILTLRSMSQAKYQSDNVGHFGLGFEFYTHFTSPIRRYPDLIVHRLLKNRIMPQSNYQLMSAEDLMAAGIWLSACEQRSTKAERQLMAIKKARFMQPLVGREFNGLVSSVTRFGVFVILREYDIDGLVRAEEIGDGRWEFDEEHLRLVAKRSGRNIGIGDDFQIIVAAADSSNGQVTFLPADAENKRTTGRPESREEAGAKRGGFPRERSRDDSRGGRRKERSQEEERSARKGGKGAKAGRRKDVEAPPPERTDFRNKRGASKPREEAPAVAKGKPRASVTTAPETPEDTTRMTPLARFLAQRKGPAKGGEEEKARPLGRSFGKKDRDLDEKPGRSGRKKHGEKKFAGSASSEPDRKNNQKRGETPDDRERVRSSRVSQPRGKNSSGPVSGRKTRRKRRD